MGLFSSITELISDTADTAVDIASATVKAGARGAKKIADDAEDVVAEALDPFHIFHEED